MFYISFGGRLGNQFLTYALAKYLWLKRGGSEKMAFAFPCFTEESKRDGFEDVLKYFDVNDYVVVNNSFVVLKYGSIFIKCFYPLYLIVEKYGHRCSFLKKLVKSWRTILIDNGIYRNYNDVPVRCSTKKNVFIVGLCTNPDCFTSIKNELMKDFTPKMPIKNENQDLYRIIIESNSVCVSIRRGDYVTTYLKDFFLCDVDYFLRAIEIIKERVENPVFIFFSDDIEWVKENIKINLPCYYESGVDPVWEKLRLMYSCKHFILSNSTFSWWAQFLSRNISKIVISPDRWYGNRNWSSPLLQDNFVKIKID